MERYPGDFHKAFFKNQKSADQNWYAGPGSSDPIQQYLFLPVKNQTDPHFPKSDWDGLILTQNGIKTATIQVSSLIILLPAGKDKARPRRGRVPVFV